MSLQQLILSLGSSGADVRLLSWPLEDTRLGIRAIWEDLGVVVQADATDERLLIDRFVRELIPFLCWNSVSEEA